MKVSNLIQMNDLKIKDFICIILVIQVALWSSVGLNALGLQIPILRQLVGLIYLFFVPGIIALRILKLHKLGDIQTLSYSVGLSIAILMFIGFLMNTIYPLLGFSKPLSPMILILTISIVVFILLILSYKMDYGFSNPNFIDIKDILSSQALFLGMIPLLAVIGTYLVNTIHSNSILMFLIVVIIIIVIAIGFNKFISIKFYPLTVFVIAIAMLFQYSLISSYIWGWDIQTEYYMSNLVITNSFWNSTIRSTTGGMNINSMLSIVMLSPIISAFTNIKPIWIFKIIYPLFFSLVPVGLYRVYQEQTNDKIAFLSVFFFMSMYVFYTEMIQVARQEIAELFLVLITLLLVDKKMMNKVGRKVLLIIFASSLGVSHYGLSYIFMASLIIICIIQYSYVKYYNKKAMLDIDISFVVFFIVFTLAWYIYYSDSSCFNIIVRLGSQIANTISNDFLNPTNAEGATIIIMNTQSHLHDIAKYMHLTTQFFIVIGLFTVILNRCKLRFENEFLAFSGLNLIFLLSCIAIPFFAALNTTRIYHIALIFLAPFCIIGGIAFLNVITSNVRSFRVRKHESLWLKALSIFLSIFFLFNSGWIYEAAKDHSGSISLSKIDYPVYNEQEVVSAMWLNNVKCDHQMYGDEYRFQLLTSINNPINVSKIPVNISTIPLDSYIFLGSYNIKTNNILIIPQESTLNEKKYFKNLSMINKQKNKIYDNDYAEVYN